MPIFQSKARTAETYLAGIGASGALMGSAFVMFVILVGVVTFNTWPHTGKLFGDGGDVGLRAIAASTPAPQHRTPNLVKILGGTPAPAIHHRARAHGGPSARNGGLSGSKGGSGGSNGAPGAPGGGQGPVQAPQPPSPPPTQPRGVVSQAVSGVGNTVQSSTDSVGSTVDSATGTNVGSVVSGLGDSVNGDVQSLAGALGGN
jgi:hypothetical protein